MPEIAEDTRGDAHARRDERGGEEDRLVRGMAEPDHHPNPARKGKTTPDTATAIAVPPTFRRSGEPILEPDLEEQEHHTDLRDGADHLSVAHPAERVGADRHADDELTDHRRLLESRQHLAAHSCKQEYQEEVPQNRHGVVHRASIDAAAFQIRNMTVGDARGGGAPKTGGEVWQKDRFCAFLRLHGDPLHAARPRRTHPRLALCAGFVCPDMYWKYLVPALESDHRVLIWNYRGIGVSGLPRDPGFHATRSTSTSYPLENNARDLEAILDKEEIEEAALVGHSMGCAGHP